MCLFMVVGGGRRSARSYCSDSNTTGEWREREVGGGGGQVKGEREKGLGREGGREGERESERARDRTEI